MKYNTQKEKLRLPAYGRLVQQMAAYALTISDRNERQAFAQRTIRVMELCVKHDKQDKQNGELHEKLWNHLAYLTNYELDVDYPYEIQQRHDDERPPRIAYPNHTIRLRHYGHLIEQSIRETAAIADEKRREHRLHLLTARMKRDLTANKNLLANADEATVLAVLL